TTRKRSAAAPGGVAPARASRKPPPASPANRTATPGGRPARNRDQPTTASTSTTAVITGVTPQARLSGVVSRFQTPPVPSRAPTAPRAFSARAANAATPAGSEVPPAVLTIAATTHGAFSAATRPVPHQAGRPGRR